LKYAKFRDLVTDPKTGGSSGHTWYCRGIFGVFVTEIHADAPQDWSLGPKMLTGQFGAFRENSCHVTGHSPYAFAVAKTEEEAMQKARGQFREKIGEWYEV